MEFIKKSIMSLLVISTGFASENQLLTEAKKYFKPMTKTFPSEKNPITL